MGKSIRLGVLIERERLRHWQIKCLESASDFPGIELKLFLRIREKGNKKSSLLSVILKRPSRLFFLVYLGLVLKSKSLSFHDMPKRYRNARILSCSVSSQGKIAQSGIDALSDSSIDLLLSFLDSDIDTKSLPASIKYGIWKYHHGNMEKYPGRPPCFWELYKNENVTGTVLYKQTQENSKIHVLKRGYFKTIKHSFRKNIDNIHLMSSDWIELALRDAVKQHQTIQTDLHREKSAVIHDEPNNLQFVKFMFILLRAKLINAIKVIFTQEKWNIGYIPGTIDDLIESKNGPDIQWLLEPGKNEFFSDPFPINNQGSLFVFFENFSNKKNCANISVLELKEDAPPKIQNLSLNESPHLSYPCIFQEESKLYLLPEEWISKDLTLYEAVDFPTQWKKSAILIKNISAVDSTLFKHRDRWWIACTRKDKGPDLRLYLFYSDSLFGPWLPHERNPVKMDIRSSRPAGNVLTHRGSLIRPAQDCSISYGGRIALNKITKLSPTEFEEQTIEFIEPNPGSPYNKGIHTINCIEGKVFLDAKRNLFSLKIKKPVQMDTIHQILNRQNNKKHRFIEKPAFIPRSEYDSCVERVSKLLMARDNIISVYKIGGFNHPGISDIDLIAVFADGTGDEFNPRKHFSLKDRYLFTHNIVAASKSHFKLIRRYSMFHNLQLVDGESIEFEQVDIRPGELKALKRQIAVEYLTDIFISMSVQLKYDVIKLRGLLQHIKSIRFDLEMLDISNGYLTDSIRQFFDYLDNWFSHPVDLDDFYEWVLKFYGELSELIKDLLKSEPLYVSDFQNLRLSRNIYLEPAQYLNFKVSGHGLPKAIVGTNRRAFNLNTRFNSFTFKIPLSEWAEHSLLEDRYSYYKGVKEYSQNKFPNFDPLISSFANRII